MMKMTGFYAKLTSLCVHGACAIACMCESKDNCGSQFSPSTTWGLGMDSGRQAHQEVLLSTEPSHHCPQDDLWDKFEWNTQVGACYQGDTLNLTWLQKVFSIFSFTCKQQCKYPRVYRIRCQIIKTDNETCSFFLG